MIACASVIRDCVPVSIAVSEKSSFPKRQATDMTTARQQFQEYYQAAHATDLLTPREKMFIGLAVTLTRTCEP